MVIYRDNIMSAIQDREVLLKKANGIIADEITEEIVDLKTMLSCPNFANMRRIVSYTQDSLIYSLASETLQVMMRNHTKKEKTM